MTDITIYTRPYCPFCDRAMALLNQKGAAFHEIEAAFDPAKKAEMIDRSGGKATFPQIFIGGQHIGGCDDLLALDRAGKLDPLLQAV